MKHEKISPPHLERKAILYVRQSSGPGVADRQLAAAAPAANETGEQGVAVLGRVTPRACLRPDDAGSQGCCR